MKKLFKLLIYIITGIIGLLILAVVALKFFIDPNDYKEEISAQASKAAGREINIEGDLSMSIYPWLGIELGKITIGNPAGFAGDFASVENAGAAVKLLPLLSKDIQIDRILLDGLNADLQVNAAGTNNWSGFGQSTEPEITTSSESANVQSLSIAAIDISNGAFSLINEQTDQHLQVSNFNLAASGIASGKPFGIDGGLLLAMPKESKSYQLAVDGDVLFNQSSGQLNLDNVQLGIVDQSAQPLPPIDLMLTGELNSQTGMLSLPEMTLEVDDLSLTGDISGRNVLQAPELNGTLMLREFNPKSVAAAFGTELPQLSDDDVMESFSGLLQIAITPQNIQLNELRATLDDTTLSGTASMTRSARPAYQFDLNVDQINLDRYLPQSTNHASTTTNGSTDTQTDVSAIPVETFRAIDASGSFSIGSVTINNLDASNLAVQMQANRNGWQFNPLSADFYDGRFSGGIFIDATGNSPILRTDDNLNNVLAQAMLSDMLGTEFVNGLALFDADLSADINQPAETLTGEVSFDIRDGAINGINIAELLRRGFNLANNLNLASAANINEEFLQGGGQTDFASLSGRFIADNGLIRNNDLRLLSPLLRVQGEGIVDLANNRIDYQVTAALVKTLQGQGGASLEELTGKQIPIRINGTLQEPKYSVDPRAIVQILAGQRVQEQKDKLLEKIGDRIGGEDNPAAGILDNVLSDALGTKPRQQSDASTQGSADEADATVSDQTSDNEENSQPSVEEEIGGALLNSLFNRRKQDQQPADSEESDDGESNSP